MPTKESIQESILKSLNNLNDERADGEKIPVNLDTRLFGSNAALDSLSLVSLIVDVETAVSEASGRDISLTDDRAMSQPVSPFSNVGTLTDYILLLLSESA